MRVERENWKSLRIFGFPWHIPHQFSLITSLPDIIQWDYYEPPWRSWSPESRPVPKNLHLGIPSYRKGMYDLAILHVDGQCADPENDKGKLFRQLRKQITDIPVVVINHGTPYIPEYYNKYFSKIEDEETRIKKSANLCVEYMQELIGDDYMISNSPRAAKQWGIGKSIIHGMYGNPQEEYRDLEKEPYILAVVSPSGWDYYYNRRLLGDIKAGVKKEGIPMYHMRVDLRADSFDDYKNIIGKALIGIFPFRESPMPRARTEMMLSGACIISTKHHNIEDYFTGLDFERSEDGLLLHDEKGDIIPTSNPEQAEIVWIDMESGKNGIEITRWVYDHPEIAKKIGQNGKKKAQEVFSAKRYRHDWYNVFKEVL